MKKNLQQIASIPLFHLNFRELLKKFLSLSAAVVAGFIFQPLAYGQADILSNLTPDQLAQFNQLPPAQRQALISQLQIGNSSGFEAPVSQPQTVSPRGGVNQGAFQQGQMQSGQLNQNFMPFADNFMLDSSESSQMQAEESDRDRIMRKAQELYDLGINLDELDRFGELRQMGITFELSTPEERALELEEQEDLLRLQQPFSSSPISGGMANSNFANTPMTNIPQGGTIEDQIEDNQEIRPFGYNLFAGVPSTYAPATDIPVSSDYIVGPGDTIVIQLYGQRNDRYELAVSREGLVQFPEVGPLNVSGLSFENVRELIQNTVETSLIGQEVSVSMGTLRSIQIFVLGESYRPGLYTVSSLATMTNALFNSGGVSDLGSLRNIQLFRNGEVVTQLDLYDLLLNGDTSNDVRLQPNDVIFINTVGQTVQISGEIRRPNIFEIEGGETIQQLLELAGGLMPTSYPLLAHIERINALGQRVILDINLSEDSNLQTPLQDGDSLYIEPVLDEIRTGVELLGHLERPGNFEWRDGIRISDILRFEDLKADPDLDYALVIREILPSRNIEVYQLNLADALNEPGSSSDLSLQPRDRLLIFGEDTLESRLDRRLLLHPIIQKLKNQSSSGTQRRVVTILGEVDSPGEYPLVENMTTQDLILAGGDSIESADLGQAELNVSQNRPEVGMVIQNLQLDLTNQLDLNSALGPRDVLTVRRLPNWSEVETITLTGEIRSPGTYVIARDEKLSDVIARAGGLTEYADPKAAIFLREELRRNEQLLLDDFNDRLRRDLLNQSLARPGGQIQQTQVNMEVMDALLADIESAVPTGRLVIDLPAILGGNLTQDPILRDGDSLAIPRTRQEIGVVGEVQLPTSHLFTAGNDVFDYINRSGGFTRNADEENIFIIKSNGAVVPYASNRNLFSFNDESLQLESGDSIVVPYYADLDNPLVTWTNISTVLFNLATTILAIESVGN